MQATRIGFMTAFLLALHLAAPASAARECGANPGPPVPVRMTNCDIGVVIGDLKRLFDTYRHRSCMAIGREPGAPDDAMARERKQAETMLGDPKLHAHLNARAAQKN
jgi:hypothetical protein